MVKPSYQIIFLICSTTLLILSASPETVAGDDLNQVNFELQPVSKVISPGLGAVVNITITNGLSDEFKVPDLWSDAFWGAEWNWTWKSGEVTYKIRERDVSYGSIPDQVPIPIIRIRPGQTRQWVAVIPIPDVLGGKSKATLTCDLEVLANAKLAADAEFLLGDQVSPTTLAGVDTRFVRSAISTGMEGVAWHGCRTPEAKAALARQAFAGDDVLLLAWFCASFADKGRFDEEAWSRLNHASGDKRAIRDANLFRALSSGRVRLSKAQADRVIKHITASYPFSDAMATAAISAAKKP